MGGFLQGMMWSDWADGSSYAQYHENYALRPFLDTVADMHTWWKLRSLGGVIVTFANMLFVVNIFNTIMLPKNEADEVKA